MSAPGKYLVSAIVSAYRAEEFLEGCLDDLLSQTIADRLEILVIDSASPEREGEIVRSYQEKHGNIRYVRTPRRETIYAAWNRGVALATAPHLTNANADDRHRKDALETLVTALEEHPEADLAYAGYYETSRKNDSWDSGSSRKEKMPPEFRRDLLLLDCYVGPQPVWRKALHEEFGLFDDRMKVAGDLEFWLRVAEQRRFVRVPELLGLYYASPTGSNAASRDRGRNREETEAVQDRYLRRYLARIDPKVSLVFVGDATAGRWKEVFADARSCVSSPIEVSAVTSRPEEATTGWESADGAPRDVRLAPRITGEFCRPLTGRYAVFIPVGADVSAAALIRFVGEVDDRGYGAGTFTASEDDASRRCLAVRGELLGSPRVVRQMEDVLNGADVGNLLGGDVEVLSISNLSPSPLRSRFSRDLRHCELDALEHAFRKGKGRSVPGALAHGELGFWKALLLGGGWREGRNGWLRSVLRGWTDFLKGIYGSKMS